MRISSSCAHRQCTKSGCVAKNTSYFTKSLETFTIRRVNHSYHFEEVHKDTNYSQKVREKNFCNGTQNVATLIMFCKKPVIYI